MERAVVILPRKNPYYWRGHARTVTLDYYQNDDGCGYCTRCSIDSDGVIRYYGNARASSSIPVSVSDWNPSTNRRYAQGISRFATIVSEIRLGQPTVVSHLLSPQKEEPSSISRANIRNQLLTLLLAGHDTTALGRSYTLYLLAANPVEQNVFELGTAPPTDLDPRITLRHDELKELIPRSR